MASEHVASVNTNLLSINKTLKSEQRHGPVSCDRTWRGVTALLSLSESKMASAGQRDLKSWCSEVCVFKIPQRIAFFIFYFFIHARQSNLTPLSFLRRVGVLSRGIVRYSAAFSGERRTRARLPYRFFSQGLVFLCEAFNVSSAS